MKWLCISSNPSQDVYQLSDKDQKILTISYLKANGTVRITTGAEKRSFLLRREGFLKNRMVLRNEYGIKLVNLVHENGQVNLGSLECNNQKYHFSIRHDEHPELVIYREAEPVCICEMPLPKIELFNKPSLDLLTLSLSWFMFIGSKTEASTVA